MGGQVVSSKMNTFSIQNLSVSHAGLASELTLDIVGPDTRSWRVFFRVDGHAVTVREEAFVLMSVISAMARQCRLVVAGPLDDKFCRGVGHAQGILHDWVPELSPALIEVSGQGHSDDQPLGREACRMWPSSTMTFFSGGVDSFHTVYENLENLSALVFVAGFSPELADTERCRRAEASVREVAAALGKKLIVVTTNLRDFMEGTIPRLPSLAAWEIAHGAALAAVAHLVADEGGTMLVPSTSCHQEGVAPWGSHPLLDPLWSSRRVTLQSDGYWANRQRKTEAIAGHQLALDHLVVCYRRRESGSLNCGTCEKCLRTMVGLLACGALERCPAFERDLAADAVAALKIKHPELIFHHECNLRILEERGIRPDIQRALRHVIRQARHGGKDWRRWFRHPGSRVAGSST